MKAILSLLIIFSSVNLNAQQTMIVYLKDKQEPTVQELESRFTDRALARRAKNHVEFDSKDWPVNLAYVNSLNSVGKILQISRWMNAVKFETSATENELLAQYDFIESIQTFSTKNTESTINKWEIEEAKTLNYGYADTQVTQINVDCLHDLGYTGEGVFVAIIDAGFNGMDTIPYFDSVYLENRLIDFHDFINDSTVYAYSGHGTAVASTIVAEMQGVDSVQYTGTGKDVDIALYVSEDVSSETQLEEFNLVAALERSDSVGVDVVNISLGYYEFDDSLTNYIYDDLDGQTTISAVGVTTAASKGIVVVTSAGNSGPDHITTPGDADSILTVGAIEGFGNYAWFSGVGPSFDGRVKPDVVARGGDAWFIRSNGELDYGNGTSFSSPITAGAVACLVGANPTMTAQEIIQTILDEYNSGIQITQVQTQKADPPDQVIDAFRDVQAARADMERSKNEAEAYANDVIPRARGEAAKIMQAAEAYKQKVVAAAEGEASRFVSIYNEYAKAREVTKERMYLETMEKVLADIEKVIIDKNSGSGVVPYLPLPELGKNKASN